MALCRWIMWDQRLLAETPGHCSQAGSEVWINYSVDLDSATCGTTGQFM